ncbi:Uncharacterised protein [uncultured Eubacterium sp.]|nr:Uncharacterised protein [uncultured Eubacterium sp.]
MISTQQAVMLIDKVCDIGEAVAYCAGFTAVLCGLFLAFLIFYFLKR